jgi:DNA-binding MarR family transcriptional regulator
VSTELGDPEVKRARARAAAPGPPVPLEGSRHFELGEAMRAYQMSVDIFDEAVADKLGLNRTDFRCIDILDQHQPMTAGALAQAARISTGTMTFVIDRLEAAGFVRRRRDGDDRRRVLVEIVPAAHRKVMAYHLPMIQDARAALAELTADEIAVVCKFLTISAAVFRRNIPN